MTALAAALLLTACASTNDPLVSPEIPAFTTTRPPGSAAERAIPATCAEVATPAEVGKAIDTLVTGDPLPVVGVPQADIGRTARIDCYYGVQPGQPTTTATVWIALAGYTTTDAARRRMTNTVTEERDAGATASDVPVGPDRGVLLRSTHWTLVAARGRTTVVVRVLPALVRDDHAGALLGRLADLALTSPQARE